METNPTPAKKRKKALKILLWAVGIFIAVGIIAVATDNSDKDPEKETTPPATTTPSGTTVPKEESSWKELVAFRGKNIKKSQVFHLSGKSVQVEYDYKSNDDDMGLCYIYVLDKSIDYDPAGRAVADLMIDAPAVKHTATIQKAEGDYYLYVYAKGSWNITVREKE